MVKGLGIGAHEATSIQASAPAATLHDASWGLQKATDDLKDAKGFGVKSRARRYNARCALQDVDDSVKVRFSAHREKGRKVGSWHQHV